LRSVIFRRYNSLAEGCVVYSALEAGGFHPSFQNYHHAHVAALYLLAFGGIILTLPEQEIESAEQFVKALQSAPIEDFDPIKLRRFGMWKRGTLFGLTFSIFLPLFFLPPEILLLIWLGDFVYNNFQFNLLMSYWLFIPLILLHAKYIAVPKLREKQ